MPHNARLCLPSQSPPVVSGTARNTPQISRPPPLAYVESILGLKTTHVLGQSFQHNFAFGACPLWSLEEPLEESPAQVSNRLGQDPRGFSQKWIARHEGLGRGQRLMMHRIASRNVLVGQPQETAYFLDALLRTVAQIVEIQHAAAFSLAHMNA
jgi:hypothetical protein